MKKFMRPMIALSLILSLLASNAIPVYADTAGVIGSASEKVDTTSWGSSGGSSVYAVSWWGYVVGIQQTKTYKDTLDKAEEYNLNAGELLIYRTFYIDNVKASYTWAANKLFYVLVEGEKAKFGDYAFDPSKYVYMDSLNAAQKAGKSFAAVYNVGTGIKAAQRKSTQNFKTSRGFWPSIAYWEIAPQNAYDRGSWEKDYIELREGTVSESSVKNAMKDQQMYIPGETYKSNINGYTVSYNGYEFGSGWQATGKSNKSGQTKEIDQGVVREQLWEAFQDKQLRIAYIGNSKVYKIYGLGDYAKIEPIYLSSDRVKYAAECLLGCFQDNDGNVANYLEAISDSVKDLNVDSTYHRALRYLDALIAIDYLVGSGSYVDELNYYLSNLNMLEDTDEALTSIVYAPAMTVMRAGSDKSATEVYKEQPRHTFTFNTYYSAIDEGAGVQKGADKVLPQVLLLLNLDAAWWGSGEFPNSDLQYMVKNTSILNKSSKKLKGVSDYEDTAYRALVDYFTSNELVNGSNTGSGGSTYNGALMSDIFEEVRELEDLPDGRSTTMEALYWIYYGFFHLPHHSGKQKYQSGDLKNMLVAMQSAWWDVELARWNWTELNSTAHYLDAVRMEGPNGEFLGTPGFGVFYLSPAGGNVTVRFVDEDGKAIKDAEKKKYEKQQTTKLSKLINTSNYDTVISDDLVEYTFKEWYSGALREEVSTNLTSLGNQQIYVQNNYTFTLVYTSAEPTPTPTPAPEEWTVTIREHYSENGDELVLKEKPETVADGEIYPGYVWPDEKTYNNTSYEFSKAEYSGDLSGDMDNRGKEMYESVIHQDSIADIYYESKPTPTPEITRQPGDCTVIVTTHYYCEDYEEYVTEEVKTITKGDTLAGETWSSSKVYKGNTYSFWKSEFTGDVTGSNKVVDSSVINNDSTIDMYYKRLTPTPSPESRSVTEYVHYQKNGSDVYVQKSTVGPKSKGWTYSSKTWNETLRLDGDTYENVPTKSEFHGSITGVNRTANTSTINYNSEVHMFYEIAPTPTVTPTPGKVSIKFVDEFGNTINGSESREEKFTSSSPTSNSITAVWSDISTLLDSPDGTDDWTLINFEITKRGVETGSESTTDTTTYVGETSKSTFVSNFKADKFDITEITVHYEGEHVPPEKLSFTTKVTADGDPYGDGSVIRYKDDVDPPSTSSILTVRLRPDAEGDDATIISDWERYYTYYKEGDSKKFKVLFDISTESGLTPKTISVKMRATDETKTANAASLTGSAPLGTPKRFTLEYSSLKDLKNLLLSGVEITITDPAVVCDETKAIEYAVRATIVFDEGKTVVGRAVGVKKYSGYTQYAGDSYDITVVESSEGNYTSELAQPYAELKQGAPGAEEFEAMAGVPTTRDLYLGVGADEYLLEMDVAKAESPAATRTYTLTYTWENCAGHDDVCTITCAGHDPGKSGGCGAIAFCTGDLNSGWVTDYDEDGNPSGGHYTSHSHTGDCKCSSGSYSTSDFDCTDGSWSWAYSCECGASSDSDSGDATYSPGEEVSAVDGKNLIDGYGCVHTESHNSVHTKTVVWTGTVTQPIAACTYLDIKTLNLWQLKSIDYDGNSDVLSNPNVDITLEAGYRTYYDQAAYTAGNGRLLFSNILTSESDSENWGNVNCKDGDSGNTLTWEEYDQAATDWMNGVIAGQTVKATVISDYLEIDTTYGTQTASYHTYDSETVSVTDNEFSADGSTSKSIAGTTITFDEAPTELKEFWDENSKSAGTWDEKTPTFSGYNGSYNQPNRKYMNNNGHISTTMFDAEGKLKIQSGVTTTVQPNSEATTSSLIVKAAQGDNSKWSVKTGLNIIDSTDPATKEWSMSDNLYPVTNGVYDGGNCWVGYDKTIEYITDLPSAYSGIYEDQFTKEAIYSDVTRSKDVNDIVIFDPIANTSVVICNPEELDTRTTSSINESDATDPTNPVVTTTYTLNCGEASCQHDSSCYRTITVNATCTNVKNVHICSEECAQLGCNTVGLNTHVCVPECTKTDKSVLVCTNPHHYEAGQPWDPTASSSHYTYGDSRCWEAHVESSTVLESGGKVYDISGVFINLDTEFKILCSAIGNFAENPDMLGIAEVSSSLGKGYYNNMDTTEWLRNKLVYFEFAVEDAHGNEIIAGELIDLNTYETDENGYYTFYVPLAESEANNAHVIFNNVAVNSPEVYYDIADVNSEAIDNRVAPVAGSTFRRHAATVHRYVDIVGYVGSLTMTDTGSYLFAETFKKANGAGWIVEGVTQKVSNEQNTYLTDPLNILRNKPVTSNMASIYGTTKKYSATVGYLPVTPADNTNPAYVTELLLPGYSLFMDFETIGNYYGSNKNEMGDFVDNNGYYKAQITPRYWLLDTSANVYKPLDVYMGSHGDYTPVVYYSSSSYPSEFIYSMLWETEKDRRSVSADEIKATQLVLAAYNDTEGTWYRAPWNMVRDAMGTAARLFLYDVNRTFIGSSKTYGVNHNKDGNFREFEFAEQAQRWHFTTGLPSSAVFVEANHPCTTDNINAVRNTEGFIVCALDIKVQGDVWTLEYDGSSINFSDSGGYRVYTGGPVYTPPKETNGEYINDPIVAIYSNKKTASSDYTIQGTH